MRNEERGGCGCCLFWIGCIFFVPSVFLFVYGSIWAYQEKHVYSNYVQTTDTLINNITTSYYTFVIADTCNPLNSSQGLLTCDSIRANSSQLDTYDKPNCYNTQCTQYHYYDCTACNYICQSHICQTRLEQLPCANMMDSIGCLSSYGIKTVYNCNQMNNNIITTCTTYCPDFNCTGYDYTCNCKSNCTKYTDFGCLITKTFYYKFTIRYGFIAGDKSYATTDYSVGTCQQNDGTCINGFYKAYQPKTFYYDSENPSIRRNDVDTSISGTTTWMFVGGSLLFVVTMIFWCSACIVCGSETPRY